MKFFWKTYAIIFFFMTYTNIDALLNTTSTIHTYYQLIIQFNGINIIKYWLNIALYTVTFISSFIVLCFAFNQQISYFKFPAILWLRFILEIFGNNFDFQSIHASFYHSPTYGIITTLLFLAPLIPSYIAHLEYIKKYD